METPKANLFVVGAMKAGTTSFVDALSQHKDVYVPPIKEPHFHIDSLPKFLYEPSRFFSIEKYFSNEFPKPLHIAKIDSEEHYTKLYSLGKKESYFVDGSTVYLAAEESAALIKRYNPEAKVIAILRDPIDRMYSQYLMAKGQSQELRNFEDVVAQEINDYENNKSSWFGYLGLSCYSSQVERYKHHFGGRLLLLNFNELIETPVDAMQKVADFLGITPFDIPELRHANKTRKLRFGSIFFLLKKLGLKQIFSKLFGSSFKQKLFKAVSTSEKQEMQLSTERMDQLKAIFEKESIV